MHAVGEALGREGAEHVFGSGAGEHEAVQRIAVVLREADLDRGDRGDGAADADERRCVRHGGQLAEHVVEVRVDEREGVAQLLGRGWIGLQLLLGQADAADRDRDSPVERGSAGRELGRPAADVDDQERRERLVELARRAEEPDSALPRRRRSPRWGIPAPRLPGS